METSEKLRILGNAAKYDASCSSSGSGRAGKNGFGNAAMAGICHSWSADGRCISLLKVLMSNACVYDCAYCVNRRSNDCERATFTPEELAGLVEEFYRRNYIEGLFLSSGVVGSPEYTMELMIKALRILREERRFYAYIHLKVIPGAPRELIHEAGLLADRLSVNIELPSERSLGLLAPQKHRAGIVKPMMRIRDEKLQNAEERKLFRSAPVFAPAGQTTQMIVGASGESDRDILRLSKGLYSAFGMKRVYFSAYMPVVSHPLLPSAEKPAPLMREHRLYQADWLMRFYQFDAEEIFDRSEDGSLDSRFDPKCAWAIRHPEYFPVEVNTAPYELLLRVPGIGVKSARRIVRARRYGSVTMETLKKTGAVMKRARYFVTAAGSFTGGVDPADPRLADLLCERAPVRQLSLFDNLDGQAQMVPPGITVSDSTRAALADIRRNGNALYI